MNYSVSEYSKENEIQNMTCYIYDPLLYGDNPMETRYQGYVWYYSYLGKCKERKAKSWNLS